MADVEKYIGESELQGRPVKKLKLVIKEGAISTRLLADQSVTTEKIQDGAVVSSKLADESVTTEKIKNGTIVGRNIAEQAIEGKHIQDDVIESKHIKDNSIPGSKLKDGTIESVDIKDNSLEGSKLADNSIHGSKIADNAIESRHLKDNSIPASKILDGTIESIDIKDGTLDGSKIKDNTITSAKLADNVITSAKLSDNSITTDKIGNLAVTESKIVANAITENKISNGAVTENKLGTGSVTTNKIVDNAITENKIGTGAVTANKIADNSVTTVKITDGAITTVKIADSSVTTAKIANLNVTTAKIADANVTEEKIADGAVTEAKLADGAITSDKIADGVIEELTTLMDTTPTAGSVKPVMSAGIKAALDTKADADAVAYVGDVVAAETDVRKVNDKEGNQFFPLTHTKAVVNNSGTNIEVLIAPIEDKAYNASSFSGLGRVNLKKNIVSVGGTNKNVLTQAMMSSANTVYKIQYDYDLNGQTITVPAGCVLEFDGGSIEGGSMDLSNCVIEAPIDAVLFRSSEVLAIPKNGIVYSAWFNFTQNNPDADIISNLISLGANIIINSGEYTLTKTITKSNSTLASINGEMRNDVIWKFNNCDAFDIRYLTISNITLRGAIGYKGIIISGSGVNVEKCRIVTFDYGVYRVNTGTSILVNISDTNFEYCFNVGVYIGEGSSGYTSLYKIIRNYFVKCGTGVDNTATDGTTGFGYGLYLSGCNAVFVRYNAFEYCSCCGIYISPNTKAMRLIEVAFNTFEQNKRAQIILAPKSLYIKGLYVDHAFSTYPSTKVSNFLKEFYYGSDDNTEIKNIFHSPDPNLNGGNNKFFTIDYEHPLGYDISETGKYCFNIPNTLSSIVDGTIRFRKGAASFNDFLLCYLKKDQTAYIEVDVATLAGSATSMNLVVRHGSQTLTLTRSSNSTVRRNIIRITAAVDDYVTMNGSYASGVSDDYDFSILPIIHKCPPYISVESASARSYITPVNFKGITIFDTSLSKLIYHNGSAWVNMDGTALS